MIQRKQKDNAKSWRNKSCGLHSLTRSSIKQRLTIGVTTVGLGLLTLAITLFPTANNLASALTISSLPQTSGPIAGGNEITIKGEGFSKTATIIAAARNNIGALALASDGRLYNWGIKHVVYSDEEAMDCRDSTIDPQKPDNDGNCIYNPVDITDLFDGLTVDRIYATASSFIVITKNNRVFTWGQNYNNTFGDGTSDWSRKPVEITNQFGGDKITDIYCDGGSTVFARGKSGDIYIWGGDYYGQLGVPATKIPVNLNKALRSENKLSEDENIIIATGANNPVLLTSKQRVLVAGNNINGQLSSLAPSWGSQRFYTDITSLFGNDEVINASSSNYGAIVYLTKSGKVLTIGNKDMIGKAVSVDQNALVDITDAFGGNEVSEIKTQAGAFIARTTNNRFYIWGNGNASKIIGDDSGAAIVTPTDVTDKLAPMGSLITSQVGSELLGLRNGQLTGIGQNEAWMINGYVDSLGKDSSIKLNAIPVDITPRLPLLRPLIQSIKFGNTEAKFTVLDSNTIKLTVPAGTKPGKVPVTITDNDGKTTTLDNAYEYIADKDGANNNPIDKYENNHVVPAVPNMGV